MLSAILMATVAFQSGEESAPAPAAQAAPADDWNLARRDDVTAAYVRFDSGLDIVLRCQRGTVESLIVGLPPAQGRTRELRVSMGDQPIETGTWYVGGDPTVAVNGYPAPFARRLREGGRINLVVPGGAENGRNLRYVLDLPSSSTAVDQTLTACGKPLVDPRDAEIEPLPDGALPSGIAWARAPQPLFPEGIRTYTWGFATVSCLSRPNGGLDACEVEAQHPLDGGFGAAALRAMRLARVEVAGLPDQPVPRRRIAFTVRFQIQDMNDRPQAPTGSRILTD